MAYTKGHVVRTLAVPEGDLMPTLNGTIRTKTGILWGVVAFAAALLAQQGMIYATEVSIARDQKIAMLEQSMPASHQSLHAETIRILADINAKVNLLLERSQ